jgi:hypothetical protein
MLRLKLTKEKSRLNNQNQKSIIFLIARESKKVKRFFHKI